MTATNFFTTTAYDATTANMQVDPAATPSGAAVESFHGSTPRFSASCIDTAFNWVPDREAALVPTEQAALCRGCPGRADCLLWAALSDSEGYWAGTTTRDRLALQQDGNLSVAAADRRRDEVLAEQRRKVELDAAAALHEPGEGSLWWYRRQQCRCMECRQANAANRARERARAGREHTMAA